MEESITPTDLDMVNLELGAVIGAHQAESSSEGERLLMLSLLACGCNPFALHMSALALGLQPCAFGTGICTFPLKGGRPKYWGVVGLYLQG